MKNLFRLLLVLTLAFTSGCGLVGILGSPSSDAEVVEAQYDLASRFGDGILVIVDQPGWVDSPVNLRREITDKINAYMRVYMEKPPEKTISYEDLRDEFQGDMNFEGMSLPQIARRMDAAVVMYVEILDFEIYRLTASGFHSASMRTMTTLYDVNTGEVLWPSKRRDSVVSLEIDYERGAEKTIIRLATANAHCILRNLYDCPKRRFRVIEEKQSYEIDPW